MVVFFFSPTQSLESAFVIASAQCLEDQSQWLRDFALWTYTTVPKQGLTQCVWWLTVHISACFLITEQLVSRSTPQWIGRICSPSDIAGGP